MARKRSHYAQLDNEPLPGYIWGKVAFHDNRLHRQLLEPWLPQWSFLLSRCCSLVYAAYDRHDDRAEKYRCDTQCALCRQVCEENDYVRGVIPRKKARYQVPSTLVIDPDNDYMMRASWTDQQWMDACTYWGMAGV